MRIQDVDSTDYECPFEAHFTNKDIAESVYNYILEQSDFWSNHICKQYGLTKEKEPWIQMFLTEDGVDYSEDEEYWLCYDVL